jgi:hypothetical protein
MSITFDSSALDRATYDTDGTLTLKFTNGDTYSYNDVPMGIFEGLRGAASAGRYFRNNILNNYKGNKIENLAD